jgi:hypothetical protein
MRTLCLLLPLLGACAFRAGPRIPPASYRIIGRAQYFDPTDNPWHRTSDPAYGTVYVLIGDGGWGCLVSASEYTMAHDDEKYPCRSGWRTKRP